MPHGSFHPARLVVYPINEFHTHTFDGDDQMSDEMISVLFRLPPIDTESNIAPEHFSDLNLDLTVAKITSGRESYDLLPFFHQSLTDVESIHYRHDVFRDLENREVFDAVRVFSDDMQRTRSRLDRGGKLYNPRQRQRWFLDAVGGYCRAVVTLDADLGNLELQSSGLLRFCSYLKSYVTSGDFERTASEASSLQSQLSQIRYNLLIKANKITVTSYDGEADYGNEVEETFERFRQGVGKDYRVNYASWPDMNRVEEEILEIVVGMNPEVFEELAQFCVKHSEFLDETISGFDREIQFYLAYILQMKELEAVGLEFCFPVVSMDQKNFAISGGFDLALAQILVKEGKAAVRNDYSLAGPERVIVVSGPNSGGKTTYARAFGQINYLASLGCPVPAVKAEVFLCDQIFTHFEREEDLDNLRGKLEDELVRIHEILIKASGRTLIIMNESFGSTALGDARILGTAVLQQIIELDATCLCVTFVDELSSISDATVSMVAKVSPEDPTIRTFEIEPRPADGLAYAYAIAQKYQLTYDAVKGRISR